MKTHWLMLLLISLPCFADTKSTTPIRSLQTYLRSQLPKKVANLFPGKTQESLLLKELGKAGESDHQILYYEISGKKYDLSVEIKNNILESFVYDPPSETSLNLENFKPWITPEKQEEIKKELEQQTGHDRGKYIRLQIPEQGISLKFLNSGEKQLKQVRFFNSQEKKK